MNENIYQYSYNRHTLVKDRYYKGLKCTHLTTDLLLGQARRRHLGYMALWFENPGYIPWKS